MSISTTRPSRRTSSQGPAKRFKLVSAVHLFLIRDNQLLLLRRRNTGYQDGNYSVVAGHLNGGEPVRAAAAREAREEIGVEVSIRDLDIVGIMHRLSDDERIDFFLVASSWSGQPTNREPHKCDRLVWFDLDRLPDNVIPYVRRAVDKYRGAASGSGRHQGPWFESFGWGDLAEA